MQNRLRFTMSCLACVALLCGCGTSNRPNLVLITVDTLGANYVGALGHHRDTTPRIDERAASGLLFDRAMAQAPWTLPSVASVLTGLYPREHGAVDAEQVLPAQAMTVSEILREEGYRTVAVVSHFFVAERYGFDQGFDVFDETLVLGHDGVSSEKLTARALQLVSGSKEPFFLWLHYFDPHFTYIRHPEFGFGNEAEGGPDRYTFAELVEATRVEAAGGDLPVSLDAVKATYDEEIAYTDAAIGDLADGLDALGFDRDTIAILTADHGEYFMERGRFGHGEDVYDELVHVPLVIWGSIPDELRGQRISDPVETRYVASTLTALGTTETQLPGRNLLELASNPAASGPVFSEGISAFAPAERTMVLERGWKLIRNVRNGRYELYYLPRDPSETLDLWNARPQGMDVPRRALARRLRDFEKRGRSVPAAGRHIPEEEEEQLRALGYVK